MILKIKTAFGLIGICMLIFSGCVCTQVAAIDKVSEKVIPVFTNNKPEKAFTELKYVEAAGSIFHRNRKLLLRLAERAKKEGADAVINVKFGYVGFAPYCTGVAVKYK